MIEVTDEMKAVFRAAQEQRAGELVAEGAPLGGHDILDRGLAAVLPIAEREMRRILAEEIVALAANRTALRELVDNAGGNPEVATSLSRARSLLRELAAIGGPLDVVPQDPDEIDGAMHSVWLHGRWRDLTAKMTTEEREAAADAVQRYSTWLNRQDPALAGEVLHLRWWRADQPTGVTGSNG